MLYKINGLLFSSLELLLRTKSKRILLFITLVSQNSNQVSSLGWHHIEPPKVVKFNKNIHLRQNKALYVKLVRGNNQVFIIDLKTLNKKQLTYNRGNHSNPVFSPNKEYIVYEQDQSKKSKNSDLWFMKSDGSAQTLLIKKATSASWSPDSKKIACEVYDFDYKDNTPSTIFIVNPFLKTAARLFRDSNTDLQSPRWSPRGDLISYSSRGNGNNRYIWLVKSDGSNKTQITFPDPKLDERDFEWYDIPTWSLDGKYLSCYREYGLYQIVTINMLNHEKKYLGAGENFPNNSDTLTIPLPIISPDGKKIAFLTNETDNYHPQLAIIPTDLDKNKVVYLTSEFDIVTSKPVWSNDSKSILFSMESYTNAKNSKHIVNNNIYISRLEPGKLYSLTDSGANSAPSW